MGLISNYNKNVSVNVNDQIHWAGSFIIRPAIHHKEEIFQLIKDSNGYLFCGVESIVSHVRIKLGKNFNNEDLDYHILMCQKYQIPMNLLMIAAYPTETVEDYEATKQWFIDHKEFSNNTINQIQVTVPTILDGTELEKNIDLQQFSDTSELRRNHAVSLIEVIKECGFNIRSFV
jgi:hypothetical protein